MNEVLGAFDRRAREFEALVSTVERQMPRDLAMLKACEAFGVEPEDAGELLERAAELRGHAG